MNLQPVLAYVRARLTALRAPTSRELAGGALVAALIGCAWCAGQRSGPVDVQEVRTTRYDTVSVAAIAKQEPPAKPGFIHSLAYKDVQPERVQVAPGAGADVLAAVCDTASGAASQVSAEAAGRQSTVTPAAPADSATQQRLQADSASKTSAPNLTKPPALAHAWRIAPTWNPLRDDVRLFVVSRDGEEIRDYRVTVPAEGRLVPEAITREARFPVKRLVSIGVIAGAFVVVGHAVWH